MIIFISLPATCIGKDYIIVIIMGYYKTNWKRKKQNFEKQTWDSNLEHMRIASHLQASLVQLEQRPRKARRCKTLKYHPFYSSLSQPALSKSNFQKY